VHLARRCSTCPPSRERPCARSHPLSMRTRARYRSAVAFMKSRFVSSRRCSRRSGPGCRRSGADARAPRCVCDRSRDKDRPNRRTRCAGRSVGRRGRHSRCRARASRRRAARFGRAGIANGRHRTRTSQVGRPGGRNDPGREPRRDQARTRQNSLRGAKAGGTPGLLWPDVGAGARP
jgi:hypothetical protein